jgi:Arc/MetJ family transcription regulator
MRTTLDIDPEKLARVQKITGERSKGRAVDRAMEEMIKEDAKRQLLAARGTFKLDVRHTEWEDLDMRLEQEQKRKPVDSR